MTETTATEIEVLVERPAHKGVGVARHDGRVVFVSGAIPGERVIARVDEAQPDAKFWRATTVDVLAASADRVEHPWPEAAIDGIGGADLGHLSLEAGRRWKSAVIGEQLERLGRVERVVEVKAAPGDADGNGLGWRTRAEFTIDANGLPAMMRPRTNDLIPVSAFPLAVPAINDSDVFERRWAPGSRLKVVAPGGVGPIVIVNEDGESPGSELIAETVTTAAGTFTYRLDAGGFWQVHRDAPSFLTNELMARVGDVAGARIVDLFCGAGLFTAPLAAAAGPDGSVMGVEGSRRAVGHARTNTAQFEPRVRVNYGDLNRGWNRLAGADLVVVDPPRTGIPRRLMQDLVAHHPPRVILVACDPAALGRDTGGLLRAGYELEDIIGLDIFPLTHHVEVIAVFSHSIAV